MPRSLAQTIGLAALALALAAPAVHAAPAATNAARTERAAALKQLQQRLLMQEALEAARERSEHARVERSEHTGAERGEHGRRGERRERLSPRLQRYRDAEAGVRRPARGVRQRPAPAEYGTPAGAAMRTAAKPLGANHVASMARNTVVNNPDFDTPQRQDGQSEPGLAAYGDNVLAAWNDGRSLTISGAPGPTLSDGLNFAWSIDGGQHWTTAPDHSMPQTQDQGVWTSDPVITVDPSNGDFYLCGLYDPNDPLQLGRDFHGVIVARGNFSGNAVVWQTPVVVTSVLETSLEFIDKPWIAVDPATHNVYISYTHYTQSSDAIVFQRSLDRGATWGPTVELSSAAAAGRVQGSRPAVGPDGEVYVVWKEIGQVAQDFMRIRRSNNFGATWGAEQTAATFYDDFGSGAPGFNREQGIALPSIAVDRSSGATRGRVYVAWNESVDYYDSLPQDTAAVSPVYEAENNDTTTTAQTFVPGVTIRGSFKTLTDLDYYEFQATAGSTYWFWSNHMPTRYTMRIFSRDGGTRLAFSGDRFNSPANDGFIAWTCPKSGAYFMRMAIFGTTLGWYRVDTGVDVPGGPGQHARDHRDAFVAWSPNGTTWSAPVNVSGDEPGRYDDWLPEVTVTPAGTVYAAWYGFDDAPDVADGGWSLTKLARSDDGGLSWKPLGAVSDGFVDWTNSSSNIIPNQGDYIALFADATHLIPAWTDTRYYGTSDIWAAPITLSETQYAIESVAADSDHVAITWHALGTPAGPVDVMRSSGNAPFAYSVVEGGRTFDGSGRLAIDDSTVAGTTQFRYALRLPTTRIVAERTVRLDAARALPAPTDESPFGVFPNPARRSLQVRFTLSDNEPANLRLYDLGGRVIRDLWYQGAGAYDVRVGAGVTIRPGVYFLRLEYRGHDWSRRVAVH